VVEGEEAWLNVHGTTSEEGIRDERTHPKPVVSSPIDPIAPFIACGFLK
jgi:hypothetical protein